MARCSAIFVRGFLQVISKCHFLCIRWQMLFKSLRGSKVEEAVSSVFKWRVILTLTSGHCWIQVGWNLGGMRVGWSSSPLSYWPLKYQELHANILSYCPQLEILFRMQTTLFCIAKSNQREQLILLEGVYWTEKAINLPELTWDQWNLTHTTPWGDDWCTVHC